MDCLFCKIIAGDIPSDKVFEDDMILAFRDINPEAPVHVLVVPKIHISSMNDVNDGNIAYVSHIMTKISEIAATLGLSNGYRVITNCGADAGQSVQHLHFHILGGKQLPLKLVEVE